MEIPEIDPDPCLNNETQNEEGKKKKSILYPSQTNLHGRLITDSEADEFGKTNDFCCLKITLIPIINSLVSNSQHLFTLSSLRRITKTRKNSFPPRL